MFTEKGGRSRGGMWTLLGTGLYEHFWKEVLCARDMYTHEGLQRDRYLGLGS